MPATQLIKFQCDYCKESETHPVNVDPSVMAKWISVRQVVRGADGQYQAVEFLYNSPKCAAQSFKQQAQQKARIEVSDTEDRRPREVIKVDETGQVSEVSES